MHDFKISNLGVVSGMDMEVHAFVATWTLKPQEIGEAKIRGVTEQIDLETKVSVRFHILGQHLRGLTPSQIESEAEKHARRLARIAIDGRDDNTVITI